MGGTGTRPWVWGLVRGHRGADDDKYVPDTSSALFHLGFPGSPVGQLINKENEAQNINHLGQKCRGVMYAEFRLVLNPALELLTALPVYFLEGMVSRSCAMGTNVTGVGLGRVQGQEEQPSRWGTGTRALL